MESVKVKCREKVNVGTKGYLELDKLGVTTVGLFAFGVGAWGLTCLFSLIATEGLLGTFLAFFNALQ